MLKVLVPVGGSSSSRQAVQYVIDEYRSNPALEIHLLNVQRPFSSHITQFIDSAVVSEAHQDASQEALRPIRQMLDSVGAPYSVHCAVGDSATSIAAAAEQLQCDHIVISSERKNSMIRAVEGSVTNKVLELTTVPVVAIAGDPASKLERYGIPAGVGAGLTWLVVAAAS